MNSILSILFLIIATNIYSQENSFTFQLPVFKSNNVLSKKTKIKIKTKVYLDSLTSKLVFEEIHPLKTNAKGLIIFNLGKGIHDQSQIFTPKKDSNYFLNLEVDFGQGFIPYTVTTFDNYQPFVKINTNQFSIGKKKIQITGPKTNVEVEKQILTEIGPNTETIEIVKSNLLTKLSIQNITYLTSLKIENNEFLQEISFPNLTMIQKEMKITFNPELCFIEFNSLQKSGKVEIVYNRINAFSLPKLKEAESLTVSYNPNLTDFNIPSLSLLTGFYGVDCSHNAFSVETVDALLEKLIQVKPLERKSIKLIFQEPSAVPSSKGMTFKNNLNDTGNFVSTD